MAGDNTDERVRLDKWLWAARFFKTRSLASDAVSGGKVQVNGSRAKPARPVNTGDKLHIRRGDDEMDIIVRELSTRRGPASVAVLLYEEALESIERRASEAEARKLASLSRPQSDHRPNKQERRKIIRFVRKSE